jgi:hypothetical protein
LDDPVYFRNIKTTSGDVCAKEYPGGGIDKFEERVGSLLLFLLALRKSAK